MEQNLNAERNALRSAYTELITTFEPNAFISLALNKTSSVTEVTRLVGRFCGMMDRRLLGHKWYRTPPAERMDGVFLIEHVSTNIHAHGLVRLPVQDLTGLDDVAMQAWNSLTEAGSSNFQAVDNAVRGAWYCTKEMPSSVYDIDQIILTRQFMKL